MPMDSKGKYHMNPHHAKMADGIKPKHKPMEGSPKEEATEPKAEAMAEGDSTTLHDKGDGSFSTDDGAEHPSIHHALSHIASKHGHDDLAGHIMSHAGGEQEMQAEPMPMQHPGAMAGY